MRILFIILFTLFSLISFAQKNEILTETKLLINKEEYSKALSLLNSYIKKDTLSPEVYTQRADCLDYIGKYDSALIDLKHAIRLGDNSAKVYCTLATVYAKTKKYDMALETYNKSLKIDSLYSSSYNSRGALYYYFLNQRDKAMDDFNHAIRINPKAHKSYYNRGIIYSEQNLYDKAIRDYSISLKLHKTQLVYNNRAEAYMYIEKYKKAIKDFSKAINYNNRAEDPFEKLDNADLYNNIARCYQSLGKERKANKYFQKESVTKK